MVIHRLRTGEGIVVQQSHCPRCNAHITWKDNIPVVSYLLLRGKCRQCGQRISIQYPLVEIITGVVFASVGYFYSIGSINPLLGGVFYVFAFACLVVIFVYDLKYMEVPMNAMWLAIAFLITANGITDLTSGSAGGFWSSITVMHVLSAAVAAGFFFGLSFVSDETWMGYGDAFIAAAIGLLLGPMGTFLALLVAFCVGAFYGIGLMIVRKKTMKTEIPFGPFLIFGLYIIFVVKNIYPDFMSLFF